MTEIIYSYTRIMKDLGKPAEFQLMEAEDIIDIPPNNTLKGQFKQADPCETRILNTTILSEQHTNTECIILKNQGQFHEEGGWPTGIDPTEFEEKMKYCKKAERDENYVTSCKSLIERGIVNNIKQNNAIDIYKSYFKQSNSDIDYYTSTYTGNTSTGASTAIKTVSVFQDPCKANRTVSALSWIGDCKKIAVAYAFLRSDSVPELARKNSIIRRNMSSSNLISDEEQYKAAYIWDLTNPTTPVETLLPQSPLCSIASYSKDPHLIAGGSMDGIVYFWDTRNPIRPIRESKAEDSHKDPVWEVKWLQSKTGEVMSVSSDGSVYVWDMRKNDNPLETGVLSKIDGETVILEPKNNEGGAKGILGGCSVDYDPLVGGPSKYLIGTEQGTILNCNRKGKSTHEKLGSNQYNGHHGPIYSVQRNPQHNKFFLSVGDWTARIWCEDFKGYPMYTTPYSTTHLTNGCWHPNRAGVFFTSGMDGRVNAWDLLYHQSTPVTSVAVSDNILHSMKINADGRHMAVGDSAGKTTLLELPSSLCVSEAQEKQTIGRMFENESTRDRTIYTRLREKDKLRLAKNSLKIIKSTIIDDNNDDENINDLVESYYNDMEKQLYKGNQDIISMEENRLNILRDIEYNL